MSDELERTNELEITCTRDIEDITAEILEAKRAGGEAILTIGRGLIEAKALLAHGEWLPWLTERVEFSERSAQNFMRLAREWSNPQTLADLGASKALALLALPAEERADFIASVHVVDGAEKTTEELSSRELAQAIRERDEARREAETARADAGAAEAARAKMAADMETANASLAAAREEKRKADQEAARLGAELAELKARPVEVAVEQVADPAAIEKARAEAVAEMQKKLDKAREAKNQAEAKRKNAEEALEQVRLQLEEQTREEKKAALGADKDLAQFELLFDQAQETVNKMRGILMKVRGRDEASAGKLVNAMKALAAASGIPGTVTSKSSGLSLPAR